MLIFSVIAIEKKVDCLWMFLQYVLNGETHWHMRKRLLWSMKQTWNMHATRHNTNRERKASEKNSAFCSVKRITREGTFLWYLISYFIKRTAEKRQKFDPSRKWSQAKRNKTREEQTPQVGSYVSEAETFASGGGGDVPWCSCLSQSLHMTSCMVPFGPMNERSHSGQ